LRKFYYNFKTYKKIKKEEVYKSYEATFSEKDIYNKPISNTKISLTNLFGQIIGDNIIIDILFK